MCVYMAQKESWRVFALGQSFAFYKVALTCDVRLLRVRVRHLERLEHIKTAKGHINYSLQYRLFFF